MKKSRYNETQIVKILKEVEAIEVDLNLPAPRIIRVLERFIIWRGYPAKLRMDNGPEFISIALVDWARYCTGVHQTRNTDSELIC